jgi:hypothetical protein
MLQNKLRHGVDNAVKLEAKWPLNRTLMTFPLVLGGKVLQEIKCALAGGPPKQETSWHAPGCEQVAWRGSIPRARVVPFAFEAREGSLSATACAWKCPCPRL